MDVLPSQLLHSPPSSLISTLLSLSALLTSIPHVSLPFPPSPAAGGPREGEHLKHSWKGNLGVCRRHQLIPCASLTSSPGHCCYFGALGVKRTELSSSNQMSLGESKKLSGKCI